jgi:hypothetical protein
MYIKLYLNRKKRHRDHYVSLVGWASTSSPMSGYMFYSPPNVLQFARWRSKL